MLTRGLATRSATVGRFAGYPRAISPPSGLGWTPSFAVTETAPGLFTTSLDPRDLKLSSAQPRYVSTSGSNANTGLSSASPKRSIWSAINVGGNDTIYVLGSTDPNNPTIYEYDHAWQSVPVQNTNVVVVSDFSTLAPGWAISSTYMAPGGANLGTWALTADVNGPHVYEASLAAAPNAVIDATVIASSGAPTKLTSRASVALVEANPGSYLHSGGKLYVRTADSRAPDTKLRPLKASVINGHLNTAISIYVERLTFEGGNARCFYLQNCATASFVDCTFQVGQQQGLELNVSGAVTGTTHTVYAVRCKFLGNYGDGCGMTVAGSTETAHMAEVDCVYSGNSGAGTEQGSSHHFTAGNTAVRAVRVNPRCFGNKTQGFADVGGCKIWILGGRVSGETTGIYCGDAGATWIQGTTLASNTTDLETDSASGAVNVAGANYKTTTGAGTVAVYHP